VHEISSPHFVTITNAGFNERLSIEQMSIAGLNYSEFLIQNDFCSGRQLEPSSTCSFEVTFSPSSGGFKEGYVNIFQMILICRWKGYSQRNRVHIRVSKSCRSKWRETVQAGLNYTIKWNAPAKAVKFTIKYSVDNGGRWETVANGVTGTSYDWSVPDPTNNKKQCRVKVIGFNNRDVKVGADTSDAPFTVEVLNLTYPNGGETFTSGDKPIITWESNIPLSTTWSFPIR